MPTQMSRNYTIYPELDRIYDIPLDHWVLVRISSHSSRAEILALLLFLRDEMIALLNELGIIWTVELKALDRKVYMRKVSP